MFAKNVFGSHLKLIICKTNYVRVRVRYARRPRARATLPPQIYILIYIRGRGGGGAMRLNHRLNHLDLDDICRSSGSYASRPRRVHY